MQKMLMVRAQTVIPIVFQLLGTPRSVLPQVETGPPQLVPSSAFTTQTGVNEGKSTVLKL